MTSAVVMGGGLAGLLAAKALTGHVDRVTVIEGDHYPDTPSPRKGLPQGYQNHMLMGGGADAIEALLPGTLDRLYEAGAHRRGMGDGLLMLSSEGWYRRFAGAPYVIACTRPLLDHVVRGQALTDPRLTVVSDTKVLGLTGDAHRVTGVRYEDAEGTARTIEADFVVDATGRRSKTPQWLTALGVPQVEEKSVDAGLGYAGRKYRAPEGTGADFPGILVQAEPNTGEPGRGAALMPQENGEWIVALMGTRGAAPPNDEDGFNAYARGLRHPVIADLIERATPAGPIRSARALANRRRFYEKLPLPEGFLAVGDAVAVLSPNYATGMSAAAKAAVALKDALATGGLRAGLGREVQAEIAEIIAAPWQSAVVNDSGFPGVESDVQVRGLAFQHRIAARMSRIAAENPVVANAFYGIASLTARQKEAMGLPVLLAALRGARKRPLSAEEAIGQFPELGGLLDRPRAHSGSEAGRRLVTE
ncbi:FAD-dependent monooxygenase [Streptomyces sp. NPDC048594]|uniref:FAD-dependent monooxygenase n=1 Tax=Streptomyces sp. NPDC048594 TaxID=3365575 RepID=UPI003711F67B